MDDMRPRQESQLFTVRIWVERQENENLEWRGKIHDVASGEVRYFREWSALISTLHELSAGLELSVSTRPTITSRAT